MLAALAVLAVLTLLAALRIHLLQLLAKALHLSQRGRGELIVTDALAILGTGTHGVLDLLQPVLEFADALRDGGFRHYGVATHAAAYPIGVALHIALDLGLLDFAESFAHLGRGLPLGVLQVAYGGLHTLLQALEVLNLTLFFAGELVGLFARHARALRAERLAHLAFEGLLPPRQILGLTGKIFHLI